MYYLDRVQKAIDYIESNLTEDLTVADIAMQGYLSPYHFHRIFHTMTGDSVMGYVRKRRLSAAAEKLTGTNRQIIDIALNYRFESQESFSRAFKKVFGITPGKCRRNREKLCLYEKKNFLKGGIKFYFGGITMEPKIVYKEAFKVLGPKLRTTSENNQGLIEIPGFWDKVMKQKTLEKITNIVPGVCYGICADYDDKREGFAYMIACEVPSLDEIPAGLTGKVIPASRYAVFTAKGKIPDKIQEIQRYIYGEWLAKSGYERAETEDFELYEERRINLKKPEVDIYIPVK